MVRWIIYKLKARYIVLLIPELLEVFGGSLRQTQRQRLKIFDRARSRKKRFYNFVDPNLK